jgi:hypothetical protein
MDSLAARLNDAWRSFAGNRPAYEAACQRYSDRIVSALIRSGRSIDATLNNPDAAWRDTEASIRAASGILGPEAADIALMSRLEEELNAIAKLVPKSIEDLALFAQAVAVTKSDLWSTPPSDLDQDEQTIRRLVEAVLAVARQQLILNGLPIPNQVPSGYSQFLELRHGAHRLQ